MTETAGGGFSVLDGVAAVAGAAVASIHMRGVLDTDIPWSNSVVVLLTFLWVGLTAVGPFLYVLRRYLRGVPGYPKVGDRLWALLGLPWLVTALLQTVAPSRTGAEAVSAPDTLTGPLLMIGLGTTSLIALAVVWGTWVMVPPEKAAETFAPPWTNRVGLFLSIAWPIQCGVGLVVIG
jgi:hypothetical protein